MFEGLRVVAVMVARDVENTLTEQVRRIPSETVDAVVFADSGSRDGTVELARSLGLQTPVPDGPARYGRCQKTALQAALAAGADIVVTIHPDYEYSPGLVPAMVSMVVHAGHDVVLGSRILGGRSRNSGMPLYKYVGNLILNLVQNAACCALISDYHTGFRAYSRRFLESVAWESNADDLAFDHELLLQALHLEASVGEISCPTRYIGGAASTSAGQSVIYGVRVLGGVTRYWLHERGLVNLSLLQRAESRSMRAGSAGER